MTESATPKDGLQKSQQQYHYIYRIVSTERFLGYVNDDVASPIAIRNFLRAFRQYADRWQGFKMEYDYMWVRRADGSVYIAISGSRAIHAAFRSFVGRESSLVRYRSDNYEYHSRDHFPTRNEIEFKKKLAEFLDPKHGRHGRGGSRS